MTRNRLILSTLISVLTLLPLSGQDARVLIGEDITRSAAQLHSYEAPSRIRDTRPPRGYKPFYVSHFGRHGSRYHTSDKFTPTLQAFARMDSLGILTDTGARVYRLVDTLAAIHADRYGELTGVGAQEHRGIALRLRRRVPRVFRGRDREVFAVASTVPRCQESMAAFCEALQERSPRLEFTLVSNEATDDTITRVMHGGRNPIYPPEDRGLELVDSVKRLRLPALVFGARLFTNPEAAMACMPDGAWHRFMYNLVSHGEIVQCLDEDVPEIYPYFTLDELCDFCAARTAACINAHGFTCENGEVLRRVGKLIVRDILDKADLALADGSHRAADLRFSHDGGVIPLMQYLRLEGSDTTWHVGQEWENGWYGFSRIPMAANIQFIFYRNRRSDVLVKILHNERETLISGLEPWKGPYYKWSVLKPYLETLANADCD